MCSFESFFKIRKSVSTSIFHTNRCITASSFTPPSSLSTHTETTLCTRDHLATPSAPSGGNHRVALEGCHAKGHPSAGYVSLSSRGRVSPPLPSRGHPLNHSGGTSRKGRPPVGYILLFYQGRVRPRVSSRDRLNIPPERKGVDKALEAKSESPLQRDFDP